MPFKSAPVQKKAALNPSNEHTAERECNIKPLPQSIQFVPANCVDAVEICRPVKG